MSFDQYPQGGRSGNGNGHRSGNGTHRADAEDRAWQQLYARVHNPCIAAELLEYFQGDPEAKRANLGLFMLAKETVRAHELARKRQERIGYFVRTALDKTFIGPFRFMKSVYTGGRSIAVEMLPPVPARNIRPVKPARSRVRLEKQEPATKRVKELGEKPKFARAKHEFFASSAGAEPMPEQTDGASSTSGDAEKAA
jgi:hypothetical protein